MCSLISGRALFSSWHSLSIKQWSCVYREGGTRIYTQALVPFNTFRSSSSASALSELELLLPPARYKGNFCTFYDSRPIVLKVMTHQYISYQLTLCEVLILAELFRLKMLLLRSLSSKSVSFSTQCLLSESLLYFTSVNTSRHDMMFRHLLWNKKYRNYTHTQNFLSIKA